MPGQRPIFRSPFLLFVACSLGAVPAHAVGKVTLSVGRVEFQGLEIEGVNVGWTPRDGAGGEITIRTARIRGIDATGPLSGFSLSCAELTIAGNQLNCPQGRLKGALGSLGSQNARFSARRAADGRLRIELDAFAFANGRAEVNLELDGSAWQVESALADADIAGLAVIAKPWVEIPEGFTVAGAAAGRISAKGQSDDIQRVDADVTVAGLNFADASGALAGEAITGLLRANLEAGRNGFAVTGGRLELAGGQAYSDPVFLDFGVHHANIDFEGFLDTETVRFEASRFSLDHEGVLQARGAATLDLVGESQLPEARIVIASLDLAKALPVYVQPYLIDTAFKDLEGAGSVTGEIEISGGIPTRAAIVLGDAALEAPSGAISIAGLNGRINWHDDATRTALAGTIDDARFLSSVAWDGASLWGIEIGKVELPFSTTGRHFRLLQPTVLPIFDGGLAIGTLRVRHAGTEQMYVRFDAELRPISVASLARAFGWPEFQGTLAGSIPDLQFARGEVTLGGNLEATVFDGRVVVRDLRLRDPLGKYPRLNASIDVDNLDLTLLTNTFSFGMITGRLSGRMQDLETFDWMPVAFDASFGTPPGDRSKHRISQRAVTNLSSIGGGSGGGVAAALQGGLLRFFDTFGYARLGLSCRLANDVCIMGGVEAAPGGYYIVKGAGLPRIDVIGSQTRVAWTRLVRQLASITDSEIQVR